MSDGVGVWIDVDATSMTLGVGEERPQSVKTNGIGWSTDSSACQGVAEVVDGLHAFTVRGIAPGTCTMTITASRPGEEDEDPPETATVGYAISVVGSSPPDAGGPDAALSDAAPETGTPPICSVPVAKVATQGERDLYMAYTDVDSGPANQTCPIHTSTDFRGDITFSFLSGSPGYSIDGRGNYEILTAVPATLHNVGATSSADALEDQDITITFRKRIFPDEEDAGTPPTWTMTFRMVSDPDPAKWQVALYSFSKL